MARVLAFLLAFTLLFQTSWAVAAPYCVHETSSTASVHFGHHVHVHRADGGIPASSALAVDDDCSGCHAGHAALLPAALATVSGSAPAAVAPALAFVHGSAPTRAPDRPQWRRLA